MRKASAQLRRRLTVTAGSVPLVLGMAAGIGPSGTASVAAAAVGMTPAVGVHPQAVRASDSVVNGKVIFSCQQRSTTFPCYGPQQIRRAYNITNLIKSGIKGQGRSIVIIDAFSSPTLRQDFKVFNSTFGLPSSNLRVIAPQGMVPFNKNDPNMVGWSAEISLDVEYAHAVAPAATITLVLARTNQDQDILNATKYAVDNNLGDVISQSFGEAEQCSGVPLSAEHAVFQEATNKGMTIFASSGDDGAAQPACNGNGVIQSVSTPASDPLVTGVGGTRLYADPPTGQYQHEVAWNDQYGASGGGFSTVYGVPSYQQGLNLPKRGVPDVAYNADVYGGVLVAWGVPNGVGAFYIFGGTSAGSPQWAGIAALTDQLAGQRIGFINPAIYSILHSGNYSMAFHDITSGNNRVKGVFGYTTARGWDPVTGVGTPMASALAHMLAFNN